MKTPRPFWRQALLAGILWLLFLIPLALLTQPDAFGQPGSPLPAARALQPHTDVGGPIATDTTWTAAGGPYIVTADVTVNPGVRLTIQPGVEVRFDGNYALIVRGALDARGAAAQPIRFTSNRPSPAPGDWAMIDVRSDSLYTVLESVVVEYGGNNGRAGVDCLAGALCVHSSTFALRDSTVQHNASRGLVLVQSDALVEGSTFDGHTEEAVRLHRCDTRSGPCRPTLVGNTFRHNASAIARHSPQDPYLLSNQASDNDTNGIVLANCMFQGANTWYADLPYVAPAWCTIGGYGPASVTIEAGAVVKIGGGLEVKGGAVLTATGTAQEPVTFTSIKDDSAGGDTNNDGDATAPAMNDYAHVASISADARLTFEHTRFRYGGGARIGVGPLVWADNGSSASFRQCEFSQAEAGVTTWRGAHIQVEGSNFHDLAWAGVDAYSSGDVVIQGNRFVGTPTAAGLLAPAGAPAAGAAPPAPAATMQRGVNAALGEPLIEDNSFEDIEVAVYVESGNPTLRDNLFEGNSTAVHVVCRPDLVSCAPVVSPGNRFVGPGQQAVTNDWPFFLCVPAGDNWWAATSGPQDPSTAQDACGLADNPGAGAGVSDGVGYSPWQGGVARPLIAQPGCGVTAQDRPNFAGRCQAGATVTLYDGERILGQTMTEANHSFAWTPTEPLTDGLHIITAQATLGGESSLPSPELPLTVDSSLFFDPAGVRILYDFHGVRYTQAMRGPDGCASASGDLSTPLWMRPGSMMTVTVPIRTAAGPALAPPEQVSLSPVETAPEAPIAALGDDDVYVKFTNRTSHTLTHVRWAGVPHPDHDLEDIAYSESIPLPQSLPPGKSVEMHLPLVGYETVDFLLEARPGVAVGRVDNEPFIGAFGVEIPPAEVGAVIVKKPDGPPVTRLYVTGVSGTGRQTFGGSLLAEGESLGGDATKTLTQPKGTGPSWLVMEDAAGTIYVRRIELGPTTKPAMVILDEEKPGANLIFTNSTRPEGDTDIEKWTITDLHLYRHLKDRDPVKADAEGGADARSGLDLSAYLNRRNRIGTIWPDGQLTVSLEQTGGDDDPYRYSLVARNGEGKRLSTIKRIAVEGTTWRRFRRCKPPGKARQEPVSPGTGYVEDVLTEVATPRQAAQAAPHDFVTYQGRLPVAAGRVCLVLCVNEEEGIEEEVCLGQGLIDPDGYVYDAEQGIEALLEGATVTCDTYDEDYQAWDRWPAELYESQINPQVTAGDGYYAFFVPPGLYRVRASAEGYEPHTSPDIRVIRDIVHYNVPLDPVSGYPVYLPLVVRQAP